MRQRDLDAVERLREFGLERRHALSLRQQDVATRAGVSLAWVGMLEAGKLTSLPRKDTLLKYAKGLLMPAESQGMLYNFLEFVLAGSISQSERSGVAHGKIKPGVLMAMKLNPSATSTADLPHLEEAPSIFHDHELRSHRLQQVIDILREDLHPNDATLAEAFLKRLYDNVPVSVDELVGHAGPRRRAPIR
jgi:transcriptional regulator with XRE-family HTH domain